MPASASRLFEPFCGSAAVALAFASVRPAVSIRLNDKNQPLADLWQRIIFEPEQLADDYQQMWEDQLPDPRTYYDVVRDRFNASGEPVLLLYLLARCVKAAVRYNSRGDFNQSPDNRRLGTRPERMRAQICHASSLLQNRAQVSAVDFMEALDSATSDDVVYLDPPYQGVSTNRDRRYRDVLPYDDFVNALGVLNSRGLSYVVSYDGRTGAKTFGRALPGALRLQRLEVNAGRSTQATFLGRTDLTVESVYLSPALVERLTDDPPNIPSKCERGGAT